MHARPRCRELPDPESNGAIVIPHAMESSPAYLAALSVSACRSTGCLRPLAPLG